MLSDVPGPPGPQETDEAQDGRKKGENKAMRPRQGLPRCGGRPWQLLCRKPQARLRFPVLASEHLGSAFMGGRFAAPNLRLRPHRRSTREGVFQRAVSQVSPGLTVPWAV